MLSRSGPPPSASAGTTRRRVVLVTPGFAASDDDWCIPVLTDYAEGLSVGNDVSIIALRYPGTTRSYRVAGSEVHSLGGGARSGLPKVALMGRAVAAVTREARRRRADVIHAFWAHEPGAVAVTAGRLTGVPAVVTVMGGELAALPDIAYGGLLTRGNRTLAGYSLGRADAIVTLCPAVHRAASDRTPQSRLFRLGWGVRTDRFHPGGAADPAARERPFAFLAVGSLVPVKGHDVILRAFARCHEEQPRTSICLVGDGPLRGALEQQARDLGIGSSVQFVGGVDHGRLLEWYHRADALVLGSWWEGGAPQVVQEALACGVPAVGTAVGVLPELTDAARCVPVGDADALGREMARIASCDATRTAMSTAALAATRPIERCIAEHERLYDGLCRARQAAVRGRHA